MERKFKAGDKVKIFDIGVLPYTYDYIVGQVGIVSGTGNVLGVSEVLVGGLSLHAGFNEDSKGMIAGGWDISSGTFLYIKEEGLELCTEKCETCNFRFRCWTS